MILTLYHRIICFCYLFFVVLVMVDFDALPKNKEKKPLGNEVKITDKKYVRYKEGAERYSM